MICGQLRKTTSGVDRCDQDDGHRGAHYDSVTDGEWAEHGEDYRLRFNPVERVQPEPADTIEYWQNRSAELVVEVAQLTEQRDLWIARAAEWQHKVGVQPEPPNYKEAFEALTRVHQALSMKYAIAIDALREIHQREWAADDV